MNGHPLPESVSLFSQELDVQQSGLSFPWADLV